MKIFLVFLFAIAFSLAAHAGPKQALAAFPRALGRTAENMVTFHDKNAALQSWAILGAAFFDARETQIGQEHHDYGLDGPMLGLKPSMPKLLTFNLGTAFLGATLVHSAEEKDPLGSKWGWGVAAVPIGMYTGIGLRNRNIANKYSWGIW